MFGLKSAVLAVVLQAVLRVGVRALSSRTALGIAAAGFVAIFFFGLPFPVIVLAAGLAGWLGARTGRLEGTQASGHDDRAGRLQEADSVLVETLPSHARATVAGARRAAAVWLVLWLTPVALLLLTLGTGNTFSRIALFFSEMAVVTFGGAYAVLAYVAQQAVGHYGWLQPGGMLDGLLTTWVTFTPLFLWIFLGAPFIERLRGNKAMGGALAGITAAVVGVILNLAVWFALHTWFREAIPIRTMGLAFDAPVLGSLDPWALALSAVALAAVFRLKLGMIPTLLGCAMAGVALHLAGARQCSRECSHGCNQV